MHNYLSYKGKVIEYSVEYKNRKSVGISVSIRDGVKVSAPKWVGKRQLQDIVISKAEWILKKLEEVSDRKFNDKKKELVEGTELAYLGRVIKLNIIESESLKKSSIIAFSDNITVKLPANLSREARDEEIKNLIMGWYKENALEKVNERVKYFSGIMGVNPSIIKVKQQKTRWGSCSSRGNINFNWKLIMFSVDIIDYVVVHELAHLKVLNHSKDFWKVVDSIMPDYKLRAKLLKENAGKLDFFE